MLGWLSAMLVAQANVPEVEPQVRVRSQLVSPLPGQLDTVPVFNSNSPELVGNPGILLSTFPPGGMTHPEAHLDYAFNGRFDVFAHHVYKAESEDLSALYLGILVHNPGTETVTVNVLAGASYLSQPDAPFITLPTVEPFSPLDPVYAGPGSRVMEMLLRGGRQAELPSQLVLAPGESGLLLNQPIPVDTLEPPINGRSTLMRLRSNGPVYVASLAQFANGEAEEGAIGDSVPAPSLEQWQQVLTEGMLSTPRDRAPTPIQPDPEQVIYGRVAGVSQGSSWTATLTDDAQTDYLTIPEAGGAQSFGISTLYVGRLGTGQNQSAQMLVRYPDTAYQAHGNYGVEYDLTLPLYNPTDEPQEVVITFETAIKEDTLTTDGLQFFEPLPPQTFFRGPVQFRYRDDDGLPRIRNYHLVQRRGQSGDSLVRIVLQPQERRRVEVNLLYPPDSTPPQVLTVKTLGAAVSQQQLSLPE
ncbi:MAG: DUF3370 domain-containing protein [Cyanobacteria bacterium J06648_16]